MQRNVLVALRREMSVSLGARHIVVWGAPRGHFSAEAVYSDVMRSFPSTESRYVHASFATLHRL